ncbi:hypothetical protein NF867_05210 [Solitalea sp. MAHUQ-68]|uniref:Uncharacterized protein n=1 Tax=Solitalea agri TaxID=2953739 RepID=A0A9X2F179_9SPHI|nr:hypothetical protein [Solitalea agri]MCO4292260.1 hypothetical protein [Solitalea agri]
MKLLLFFASILLAASVFGQNPTNAKTNQSPGTIAGVTIASPIYKNDSIPVVWYADTTHKSPSYFLNGELINKGMVSSLIKNINPSIVDSIYVKNKEVYIKTKNNYNYIPKAFSLTDLKVYELYMH